jgi:hypothetical protein
VTAITRKLPGAGLNRMIAAPERVSGMPARFIVPMLTAGIALQVAVLGMYWDVAYHIDHGRDAQVFTLPHTFIVLGLQGIFASAVLHGWMKGPRARGERRVGPLSLAPGGAVILFCSSIALVGFPLDDVWHRLFGEDVTLWGPTHLFMIGGAGFSTLGLWMLHRHGSELGRPRKLIRRTELRTAGALLIGLSTFQAEFDFGVPQFQMLYQPVLIAFAAAVSLVAARSLLGPWGAVRALAIFFAIRGALALIVGPAMGFTTPHFPLYVVEALVVEAAALLAPRNPLRFALLSGAGIGTLGLGAEWIWSHVWMPHAWTASLLPEALILTPAVAVGGAVLGARIAQSLAPENGGLEPIPGRAVAIAGLAALVALAFPLPRTGGDGTHAAMTVAPAGSDQVRVDVKLDPPAAAKDSDWFEVLAWQGREKRRIVPLAPTGPGTYRATEPIPSTGNWKALVRLAKGPHLMAMPVYLSASPTANRPAVPAHSRAGAMTSDTFQLQREATGGPKWLTTTAYAILAAIVATWLALTCWALRRAEPDRPRRAKAPRAAVPAAA